MAGHRVLVPAVEVRILLPEPEIFLSKQADSISASCHVLPIR